MRVPVAATPARGFRHEAFFYVDPDVCADRLADFLRAGLDASEPVMAVLPGPRLQALQRALGADAEQVMFADMTEVGRNPARIIPEWRRFVDGAGGRPMRGVGEALWVGRGRQEAVECHRHEWLLQRAFMGDPQLWLVCPYDANGLDAADIETGRRLHPDQFDGTDLERRATVADEPLAALPTVLRGPFPVDDHFPAPPAPVLVSVVFGNGDLAEVRDRSASAAALAGLDLYRAEELSLAVHEVAANVLRHTGGGGELTVWATQPSIEGPAAVVCQVSDHGDGSGAIADPLVGRVRPPTGSHSGRGLWLANQLCDLVQLHTSPRGTVVRLHALLPVRLAGEVGSASSMGGRWR